MLHHVRDFVISMINYFKSQKVYLVIADIMHAGRSSGNYNSPILKRQKDLLLVSLQGYSQFFVTCSNRTVASDKNTEMFGGPGDEAAININTIREDI